MLAVDPPYLAVRVGVNYRDYILRDIEPAPHGLTDEVADSADQKRRCFIADLDRLLTATAVSRVPGDL